MYKTQRTHRHTFRNKYPHRQRFDIPLRLHQIGAAKTELKSDLTEAGINQTKYSLYLTVTIEMTAILPAHSTDIVVSYDYPVSETVIVGEIPDMYLDKGKG